MGLCEPNHVVILWKLSDQAGKPVLREAMVEIGWTQRATEVPSISEILDAMKWGISFPFLTASVVGDTERLKGSQDYKCFLSLCHIFKTH